MKVFQMSSDAISNKQFQSNDNTSTGENAMVRMSSPVEASYQ